MYISAIISTSSSAANAWAAAGSMLLLGDKTIYTNKNQLNITRVLTVHIMYVVQLPEKRKYQYKKVFSSIYTFQKLVHLQVKNNSLTVNPLYQSQLAGGPLDYI